MAEQDKVDVCGTSGRPIKNMTCSKCMTASRHLSFEECICADQPIRDKKIHSGKKRGIAESTCSSIANTNKQLKTKFSVEQRGCSKQVSKDKDYVKQSHTKFSLKKEHHANAEILSKKPECRDKNVQAVTMKKRKSSECLGSHNSSQTVKMKKPKSSECLGSHNSSKPVKLKKQKSSDCSGSDNRFKGKKGAIKDLVIFKGSTTSGAVKLMLKGTTLMAIHCVDGLWCLAGDTTNTRNDGEADSKNKLKIVKTSSRFATLMTGPVDIVEIILWEVRAYLDENKGKPGATKFANIVKGIKKKVIKRMNTFIDCCGAMYEDEYLFGALTLVNRNKKRCLVLGIVKEEDEKTYNLFADFSSRVWFGGAKAGSLFNKIPSSGTVEEVTADVLEAMETAANSDHHTGGILTIFTGGKKDPWRCVYADDFQGMPSERKLDNRTEGPEEEIQVGLRKEFNKPGRKRTGFRLTEVDGVTIHVPTAQVDSLTGGLLTELLKVASYGSVEKYPILRDANFSVVVKTPSEIEVHIKEEFPVEIQTPNATVIVYVNDVTTVGMLREKLSSELNKRKITLDNIDGRILKLETNADTLQDDDIMYSLGVRSCPNKKNLLWKATDRVHIDRVQERQKQYTFQML